MDALRASTMFLLVPVHAAGLLAVNGSGGAWSTGLYWIVHVFRLPLFFAMSGFFLALLISTRGLGGTARNRTIRIVGPFAIGLVTLVPLLVLASQAVGVSTDGDGSIREGSPFIFEPSAVWFLWYLLLIDAVAISVYLLGPGLLRAAGGWLRPLLARPVPGIALLAIPVALALLPAASWTVQAPADTFVPDPVALAYYAIFFAFGAALCAHRPVLEDLARDAWSWALAALALTIPAGALFTVHNSALGSRPAVHVLALLVYAAATWTTLLALVGLAGRYLSRSRPRLRYVADSSYWIFLSHMPAMVLLIGLTGTLAIGTGPAFFLVTAGSLAFSLITYPLFVRHTAIGWLLNGPRERVREPPPPRPRFSVFPPTWGWRIRQR